MTTPTIAEMLKYADLQMAAEALYDFDTKTIDPAILPPGSTTTSTGHYNGQIDPAWLTLGNEHVTRFTPTQAKAFVDQWKVIDHISNTTTGFSGTLFQAIKDDPAQGIKAGQYVLSIRSTEFIDDAVRDNQATNKMEVKEHGWAFGQISDMEAWYAKLKADGKLPAGAKLDVTGYSLGGHLATAFTLLHPQEVGSTYTFNGAGVGDLTGSKTLAEVIADFQRMRLNADGQQIAFTDDGIQAVYDQLKTRLNAGERVTLADFTLLENTPTASPSEKTLLRQALANLSDIWREVDRVATINDSQGKPASIASKNSRGRKVLIGTVRRGRLPRLSLGMIAELQWRSQFLQ